MTSDRTLFYTACLCGRRYRRVLKDDLRVWELKGADGQFVRTSDECYDCDRSLSELDFEQPIVLHDALLAIADKRALTDTEWNQAQIDAESDVLRPYLERYVINEEVRKRIIIVSNEVLMCFQTGEVQKAARILRNAVLENPPTSLDKEPTMTDNKYNDLDPIVRRVYDLATGDNADDAIARNYLSVELRELYDVLTSPDDLDMLLADIKDNTRNVQQTVEFIERTMNTYTAPVKPDTISIRTINEWIAEIQIDLDAGKKINAIKYLRTVTDEYACEGLGLKESKDLVELQQSSGATEMKVALTRLLAERGMTIEGAYLTRFGEVVNTAGPRSLNEAASKATAQVLADQLGVAPEAIERVTMRLERLKQDGALMQVHVKGTSKLLRKTSDAERAISADDVRKTMQTAGQTYTLPEEAMEFRSIGESVRANLKAFGFDVTGFRPFYWIPVTGFQTWYEKHMGYVTRWETLKETVIEKLPQYTEQMRGKFERAARRSWTALVAQAERDGELYFTVGNKRYAIDTDERVFENDVISAAMSRIPSEQMIRDEFTISIEPAIVQMGSDFEAEINASRETVEARQFMREIVREKLRETINTVSDPLDEVIAELRRRTAEDAASVIETIKAREYLPGPSVTRLLSMVQRVQQLSMGRDTVLLRQIDEIAWELTQKSDNYNIERISDALGNLITLSKTEPVSTTAVPGSDAPTDAAELDIKPVVVVEKRVAGVDISDLTF